MVDFNRRQLNIFRVVIDTNLLVAAFFNKRSASSKILKMADQGKIVILWTLPIKNELELILGNIIKSLPKSFARKADIFRKFLNKIFKKDNKISHPPKVNLVKEDPQDDKFLSCALGGKADLIISNDHHLLHLKQFKKIPILTPEKAVNKLTK